MEPEKIIRSIGMTSKKIVQYVIMRRDLIKTKKSQSFSTGAYIAQACHASTAALHIFASSENTHIFLNDIEDMTVCVLGVEDKQELESIERSLSANGIPNHLWIEKPEIIPTALATAPVEKHEVGHLLSHLKLLR
jgi:peptidyl-tRNA hydrolase